MSFPSLNVPVDETFLKVQSLQGATRHFISPEAYRAHQLPMDKAESPDGTPAYAPAMRRTITKGATARMNVLDYLSWLNLSMRLICGQRAMSICKSAEMASATLSEAEKVELASFGESEIAIDADLEKLLKSLPNVDYPASSSVNALMNRAAVIEGQVNSLLYGQLPRTVTSVESFSRQTSLHPPSLLPPRTTKEEMQPFARLRYNCSCLLNLWYGGKADDDEDAVPTILLNGTLLPTAVNAFRSVSIFSPARSERVKAIGVPPSLLARKFGWEERDQEQPIASTSTSPPALQQNPHHDYRIVHSQAVRNRAKVVFAQPVLNDEKVKAWCPAHRVQACTMCAASPSSHPILQRCSLAQCLEDFLIFSADCFSLLTSGYQSPAGSRGPSRRQSFSDVIDLESHRDAHLDFTPTSSWYALVVSLVTQSCLNGYLLHSWVGKEPVEILFGVGCGIWEGRPWGEGFELTADMDREKKLHEACRKLFGSRNPAQAEFEREMRDRTHEFLNLEGNTLATHLASLNAKYPASASAELLFNFLSSVQRFIGVPKLAKYGNPMRPGQPPHDFAALEHYVSRFPQYEADKEVAPLLPTDSRKRAPSSSGESAHKKLAL